MLASRVLALLAALLVVWRVVPPASRSLVDGTGTTLTVAATVALLMAGVALVVVATVYGVARSGRGRGWFAGVLAGFLLVMAGYLVLGAALGAHVPWTAYAVLAGVSALGGGALVAHRRAA